MVSDPARRLCCGMHDTGTDEASEPAMVEDPG